MSECKVEIIQKVAEIISRDISKLKFVSSNKYSDAGYKPLDCWDCWTNSELPTREGLVAIYQIDTYRELIFSFSNGFFGKHIYATVKLKTFTPKTSIFGKDSVEEIPVFTNECLDNSILRKILLPQWQAVCKVVNDAEDERKQEQCKTALEALSI